MDWGAFASGFAGGYKESWQNREAEERKLRTAEQLEKLRRETSDYEFNRNLNQERKEVKRSEFDPEKGETVDYNAEGTAIGRRRDAAASEAYKLNREKAMLDLEDTRSEIAARKERLALDRADLGERRAARQNSGAAQLGAEQANSPSGAAKNLIYVNKSIVDALVADGIPADEIARAATLSVNHAANRDGKGFNPDRADTIFLDSLRRLRGGIGEDGKWSIDTFRQSRKP